MWIFKNIRKFVRYIKFKITRRFKEYIEKRVHEEIANLEIEEDFKKIENVYYSIDKNIKQNTRLYNEKFKEYDSRLRNIENSVFFNEEGLRKYIEKIFIELKEKEIRNKPDNDIPVINFDSKEVEKIAGDIFDKRIRQVQINIGRISQEKYNSEIGIQEHIRSISSNIQKITTDNQNIVMQNINLQQIVQQQDIKISSLEKQVKDLMLAVDILTKAQNTPEEKKDMPVPAEEKTAGTKQKSGKQETVPVHITAVFDDNPVHNKKSLEHFITQIKKTRGKFEKKFTGKENAEIYLKLTDKCLKKFENLLVKFQEKEYEAGKLASESAKILKQTLIRALSQKMAKEIIYEYMELCGIRKVEWAVGKIMKDDDYNYLDEPVFYEEVEDINLDNVLMEIQQDAFIIDYIEDDCKYEEILPGIYKIGKIKN